VLDAMNEWGMSAPVSAFAADGAPARDAVNGWDGCDRPLPRFWHPSGGDLSF